jgi:hypothetical protein
MKIIIVVRHLAVRLVLGLCLTCLSSCGGEDNGGAGVAHVAPPIGAVQSLAWQPVEDQAVTYYVHYGKQSPGETGSCDYEHSQQTTSPSVTITGLDLDTRYYVAVSAFNGHHSLCSNEVSFVTAPS